MRRAIASVALSLTACMTETLDAGSDMQGAGTGAAPGAGGTSGLSSPPPGEPLPDWSAFSTCSAAGAQLPFVGTWEGNVEDEYFHPLSPVRLVVNGASDEGVCGSILIGTNISPPPRATDGDANYPSGNIVNAGGGPNEPHPGMTYTIVRGGAQDDTLRFGISFSELWKDYCELQTPQYEASLSNWQCLPNTAMRLDSDSTVCTLLTPQGDRVEPASKCAACTSNGQCSCNETGCTASVQHSVGDFEFVFTQRPEGDVLMGGDFGHTIHLERVE